VAATRPGGSAFARTRHTPYDIVRKGLAGTSGGDYKMEVLSSGAAYCRFGGTNVGVVQGGTNLGTGTHVVRCAKTSSSVKLIVNGVTKTSKTVTVGSISNSQPVILAAKPGDDFTKGLIDYITITRASSTATGNARLSREHFPRESPWR
jgi:hypothetical protein